MGLAVKPDSEFDERRASTSTPRVPLIGVDAGAIPGTKPGCTVRALMSIERDVAEAQRAQELERAGRGIVRSRLHRRRFKPA